tara:strand:- start:5 stop:154 length:150 start_codon:yes stop_codon:yes gene_type:complete
MYTVVALVVILWRQSSRETREAREAPLLSGVDHGKGPKRKIEELSSELV